MDTIVVERVKLKDGLFALKYPKTPEWLWDMEGYYFISPKTGEMYKMSNEQIGALLPTPPKKFNCVVYREDRFGNQIYYSGDSGIGPYWAYHLGNATLFESRDAASYAMAKCASFDAHIMEVLEEAKEETLPSSKREIDIKWET